MFLEGKIVVLYVLMAAVVLAALFFVWNYLS
jgi:hypothetical protein